jgi:hypothetical protein
MLAGAGCVCSPVPLWAGPHHFPEWLQGEVVKIDRPSHSFTLRSGSAGAPTEVAWDGSTELFADPDKPAVHVPLAQQANLLQAGDRVLVYVQMRGHERHAIRVVRDAPAAHAKTKPQNFPEGN